MKKILLLLPFVFVSNLSRADTQIGSWGITINGTVLPSSCDIDTGKQQKYINLGTFSAGIFSNVGDVSTDTKFNINLSGCGDSIAGAKVTFSGTAASGNTDLLALTDIAGTGMMARGVGVEIKDSSGAAIPLNKPSSKYALSAGDNTLSFLLHYKATAIPVTAGYATAVMYFDLDYQ